MLASASGPLGALLMIAPLAAIPVFAVMGIPHFAPVSASPADEEEIQDFPDSPPVPAAAPRPTPKRTADDLFAPLRDAPNSRRAEPPSSGTGSSERRNSRLPERDRQPDRLTNSLPPEALDDWEVATNLGTGRSRRKQDRELPTHPETSPEELPPIGEPGGRRDDDAEKSSETLDDSQRAALQRKTRNRGRDGALSAPQTPREFHPGLIEGTRRTAPAEGSKGSNRIVEGPRESSRPTRSDTMSASRDKRDQSRPGLREIGGPVDQSGWRMAAQRLKELGIRKYRLESRIEEQQFRFRCEYPTPETPNVTELFEADADSPLDAVLETLRQIDEWLQQESGSAESADEF